MLTACCHCCLLVSPSRKPNSAPKPGCESRVILQAGKKLSHKFLGKSNLAEPKSALCILLLCVRVMVGPKDVRLCSCCWSHFGARWSAFCPTSWPWEMDVLGPIPVHQILISPGYNNLLIKSWASVPGSESGLCPAKNTESLPELGDFSHPVKSKTHRAATAGKKKRTTLSIHSQGEILPTRQKSAVPGTSFCSLQKVADSCLLIS